MDRSVKLWSLDDRAYVDTLFGHQAEVLAVDALRQERVVTGGHDHTCRVWKIPEESQLIYRATGMAIDCCRSPSPPCCLWEFLWADSVVVWTCGS